ncbi:MAG: hypothetical protein JWO15_779, partial [Sphingomonadales bacterium]|nr:hypothetical protein [Sphingomonadales bacterium]
DGVMALHKRLSHYLPIARNDFGNVSGLVAIGKIITIEMIGKGLQRVHERCRGGIEIDKDEAPPTFYLHFGQTGVHPGELRKVPTNRIVFECTRAIPRKPMILAAEIDFVTAFVDKLAASVQATVVKSFDRPVLLTCDDQAFSHIFVHKCVAGIGNVLVAAGPLPDLQPDVPYLLRKMGRIEIIRNGNTFVAEVARRALPKMIGDFAGVALQNVLIGFGRMTIGAKTGWLVHDTLRSYADAAQAMTTGDASLRKHYPEFRAPGKPVHLANVIENNLRVLLQDAYPVLLKEIE